MRGDPVGEWSSSDEGGSMANASNENLRVRQTLAQFLASEMSFFGHFVLGRLYVNCNELIHGVRFKTVSQLCFVNLRPTSTNLVA
tara:strand:- start:9030 stop:9284 length:255 start_codon:yes stop_codon:yes gene_type:complete